MRFAHHETKGRRPMEAALPPTLSPYIDRYLDHYRDQAFPVVENGTLIGMISAMEVNKIPRLEWGVGMAEKTIRTGLCPGGRLRMERMLRLLQNNRLTGLSVPTASARSARRQRLFYCTAGRQEFSNETHHPPRPIQQAINRRQQRMQREQSLL